MKRNGRNYQVHMVIAVLALVTVLAYLPVLHADFINFDDELYVTLNPHVQSGLTADSLKWAFNIGYEGNWTPLTWISHMLVRQVFGPGPAGPHAVNLFLHVANVILLLLVLNRMTKSLWKSAFVAALFAVHPIHVESVAWVVERKDVLSGIFWLLTMWAYVRYSEIPSLKRYAVIIVCFALGLMSKPTLVTLPLVLLLLDYWPLGRWADASSRERLRLVWQKVPLCIMTAVACILTYTAGESGGILAMNRLPLFFRIDNAVVSYVSYVGKMLWPAKLAVLYPYRHSLPMGHVASAIAILVVVTLLVIRSATKRPYLPVGWFWYLIVFTPMIGVLQVGEQAIADRYAYIPFMGLYIIIVWGLSDVFSRRVASSPRLRIIPMIVILVLAGCTWRQAGYWHDSVTLWTHALAVTTNNAVAHYSLGNAYKDLGESAEAVPEYEQAVSINPRYAKAYNNLGVVYFDLGRNADAVNAYKQAIRIKRDYPDAYYNLGIAYHELGKSKEAVGAYVQATRFRPNDPDAHYNLGSAYFEIGKSAEAIGEYQNVIRIMPGNADAYFNLGNAYGKLGRYAEAVDAYRQAIQINPDYADAHYNLADAYARLGRYVDAAEEYRQVIRINPGDAEAHFLLGIVYCRMGSKAVAQHEYETLKELAPPLANKLFDFINK